MNPRTGSIDPNHESIDGRTARRDRGRVAVIEAALQLFNEGDLEPSPELIATRAGVSTRSVYRYFDDREGLIRAVIAYKQMQVLPLFRIEDLGHGDLDLRLERFADSRLKVYETIGATARVSAIRAAGDPVVRENLEFRKSEFRKQVERHFAPELDAMTPKRRMIALNAVDTLSQIESLDRLSVDLELSAKDCRQVLIASIRSLLTATD